MPLLNVLFLFLPISILPSPKNESCYVHIVDYANPTPLQDIKERYSAYDMTDGDLTEVLTFETLYDENTCTIGYYDIKISVINSKMNETIRIDKIMVRDFIAPMIELKQEEIYLDINDTPYIDALLPYLSITDNLDSTFDICVTGLEDIKTTGTYILQIYAMDSSFNKSNTVTLTIHAIQKISKKLLNDSIYVTEGAISKADVLSWFLQHEDIQLTGNTYSIESNYFYSPNQNGIYQVSLKIIHEDETCQIYMSKINVAKKKAKEQEKNTLAYISFIILSGLCVLGIIIYRKRN